MINYDKELKEIISKLNKRPSLLLHSCCGPCSSYVISYLIKYFDITIFYYNPCIEPMKEYEKRKKEQIKFINNFKTDYKIKFLDSPYENEKYRECVKEHESDKEGGTRCTKCFYQRLSKTFEVACENNFDFFATTLTVSPHKNSEIINKIGLSFQGKTNFLVGDFKKNSGYLESVKLSKEYNLYRQDYCGCLFSKKKSNK